MKATYRFVLAACLCMAGLQVAAQGIIVYKTDGTKVYYRDSEVERVGVYGYGEEPEPQPGDEPTPDPQPGDEPTSDPQTSEGETTKTFTVTGNGKTVTFTMKLVEAGTFQMGRAGSETPVHQVTLTKNYYMGETEVTQALWYAVMGKLRTSDGSQWVSHYGLGDNKPAYYVSWNDCQTFIKKLNALTGATFRLPTEAEWEFAARGGNKSKGYTYAGSNTIGDVAWYYDNTWALGISSPDHGAHAVATKAPNELGLYDMSGNVWEWCQDWKDSYSSDAQTDPTGPTSGSGRVIRGGGWGAYDYDCSMSSRRGIAPDYQSYYNGFRLAL